MDRAREAAALDDIASDSWYARGANAHLADYSGRVLGRFWRGTRCLELGPAEGLMTARLAERFEHLTAVEGSEAFASSLCDRFPSVRVVTSLFEDFVTDERFDTIVLGNVLEHVASPRDVLAAAARWLAPDGRVCAAVPNARSVHRQAAVIMGLLREEHELNEADRHHRHRRVYDPESLRADFVAAGLRVEVFGGYWLKPLSNAQIDDAWTPEMLEAFMALGERYPDIAAQIYVVAAR